MLLESNSPKNKITPKRRFQNVIRTVLSLRKNYVHGKDLTTLSIIALLKSLSQRSQTEQENIEKLMSRNSYFMKLKQKHGQSVFQSFCDNLYFRRFEMNKAVINISQEGHTFYVILNGSVGVNIYQPKVSNSKQMDQEQCDYIEINTLTVGDSFGELALLDPDARTTADVITKEISEFACLDRKQYWEILGSFQQFEINRKLDFMKNLCFLQGYYEQDLKTMSYCFKQQFFKRNQTIFKQDDVAKGIYFVREGEIELWRTMKYRRHQAQTYRVSFEEQKENLICLLPIGALFGEEELLNIQKRKYTAKCGSTQLEVYSISKNDLDKRLWLKNSINTLKQLVFDCTQSRLIRVQQLETWEYLQTIKPKDQNSDDIKENIKLLEIHTLSPRQGSMTDRVGTKVDNTSINKFPKVCLFDANEGIETALTLKPSQQNFRPTQIKPVPSFKPNQQWIQLNLGQRAKNLGMTGIKSNWLSLKKQERILEERFDQGLKQYRKTYFKNEGNEIASKKIRSLSQKIDHPYIAVSQLYKEKIVKNLDQRRQSLENESPQIDLSPIQPAYLTQYGKQIKRKISTQSLGTTMSSTPRSISLNMFMPYPQTNPKRNKPDQQQLVEQQLQRKIQI